MSNKKVLLAILDGFGISENQKGNAIHLAKTPNLDKLMSGEFPYKLIGASGKSVGLPDGQIGNSEVGHLNIGAGRIVYTGLSRINNAIETNQLNNLETFKKVFEHAKSNSKQVHIMGLLSPGGVHSHQEQIYAFIELVNQNGLTPIIHIFGDGRDVPPRSIKPYIEKLQTVVEKNNGKIASISGRFYAMDRDQRWDRVEAAYNNLIGASNNEYENLLEYVDQQYAKDINDEFIEPAHSKEKIFLKDDDTVIFANFRPDRAREMSHLIHGSDYYNYHAKKLNNVFLATLMTYEGIKPDVVLFPPETVNNTLGKVIADANLSQLRIAETEKYAHVTFFFDGGIEVDYQNEKKVLVPSPKVRTYDLLPEMSAVSVCDQLINLIPKYDVIILNFANPDMVGHTGNLEKTIESIEVIDAQIGKLWKTIEENNGVMFITADHGNAELMLDENDNVVTAHSTNDVPFISTSKAIAFNDKPAILANIAPTIIDYLDLKKPKEMDQDSFIVKK